MFFSKNPVRSFLLKVSPGGPDKPVAFGPGSVINGIVNLTLDKPVEAYNVRTVFKCEITESGNRNVTSNVFSIEAILVGKPQAEQTTMTFSKGPHQYLFAIKMPQNNYPPSLRPSLDIGHRIEYTLQAFLETKADTQTTGSVPVIYLPLIICPPPADSQGSVETVTFSRGDSNVQVAAELVKPACLPGDVCTIKLTTNNQSDCKITQIQVELVATTTLPSLSTTDTVQSGAPILPTDLGRRKRYRIQSETFDVAIPKHTKEDRPSIIKFNIPDNCVPTFQSMADKYINISYEIVVTMPLSSNGSWFSLGHSSQPNTISLPITIVTVRNAPYPIYVSSQSTNEDLPSFIPNIESPMPSPSSPFLTPGGSVWGSPVVDPENLAVSPSNSHFDLEEYEPRQDASGMLMVPLAGDSASQSRRKSTSSSATAVSDNSAMNTSNQVIVQ